MQSIFQGPIVGTITNNMELIIAVAALIEAGIFFSVAAQCRRQASRIGDTFTNAAKGMSDFPDFRTGQSVHDRFLSMCAYLERKAKSSEENSELIKRNISAQIEKNDSYNTFSVESLFNVASALVQVFPLLGIMGTILALAQIQVTDGAISPTDVTQAFVTAIDTTVMGMFFAIVFMMWEARAMTRVKRILEDSERANRFISELR